MLHNSNKYVIHAARENAQTTQILRAILPYVKFFNEASVKPLIVQLYSAIGSDNRNLIDELEREYDHELDPVFMVDPNRNIINVDSIVEYVKNVAVRGKSKNNAMSEHSPLGRLQKKPADKPTEIDSMKEARPNSDKHRAPKTDNWKSSEKYSSHYEVPPSQADKKVIDAHSELTPVSSDISEDINDYFKHPGPLQNHSK